MAPSADQYIISVDGGGKWRLGFFFECFIADANISIMNVACRWLILTVASTMHQSTWTKKTCKPSHNLVQEMMCTSVATLRDILPCDAQKFTVTAQPSQVQIRCGTAIEARLMTLMPSVTLQPSVVVNVSPLVIR